MLKLKLIKPEELEKRDYKEKYLRENGSYLDEKIISIIEFFKKEKQNFYEKNYLLIRKICEENDKMKKLNLKENISLIGKIRELHFEKVYSKYLNLPLTN